MLIKKLSWLFLLATLCTISFGASIKPNKSLSDSNIMLLAFGQTDKEILLVSLSKISVKDFEVFTSKKMNFFDRITFGVIKKKLKKSITENRTFKNEKLIKLLTGSQGDQTGFHAGGFVLGFLVGLPGVLISYIIEDNYKRKRIKWSWMGFALRAVIVSILFLLLF